VIDQKSVLYIPHNAKTIKSDIESIKNFVQWAHSNNIKTVALPLSMAADLVSARRSLRPLLNSINILMYDMPQLPLDSSRILLIQKIVLEIYCSQLKSTNIYIMRSLDFSSLEGPQKVNSYDRNIELIRSMDLEAAHLLAISESISFNDPSSGKKRLLLDVSVIVDTDARSGIQRVVRGLLSALLAVHSENLDICPIYFRNGRYFDALELKGKFTKYGTLKQDVLTEYKRGDVYLALDLNTHLVELAHLEHTRMAAVGVSFNFIVYDIILIQNPQWWPPGTSDVFSRWLESICEIGDRLLCISKDVQDNLERWLAVNRSNDKRPEVNYFPLSGDIEDSVPSRGMPDGFDKFANQISSAPTFLMVGTLEPRKAHGAVLDAFEVLWSSGQDINLVVVGKMGWLVEDLAVKIKKHPEFEKRLFWLNGVSDECLTAVYMASACVIMASYAEGFGLPLVEASKFGLPIIARDIPIFREVAGDHVFYFANDNDIANCIYDWQKLYCLGIIPDSSKISLATWNESARQILRALNIELTENYL
jgi:glycosyltransferase involved in cell wall biosynthesis